MTWMCCQKIDLSSQNSILMSVNGIYSFQILRKMSTKLSMKLSSWTIKESLGSNKFQKRTRVPPMNLPPKQSQRQMQLLEVSCSFSFSSFHISVGFWSVYFLGFVGAYHKLSVRAKGTTVRQVLSGTVFLNFHHLHPEFQKFILYRIQTVYKTKKEVQSDVTFFLIMSVSTSVQWYSTWFS